MKESESLRGRWGRLPVGGVVLGCDQIDGFELKGRIRENRGRAVGPLPHALHARPRAFRPFALGTIIPRVALAVGVE